MSSATAAKKENIVPTSFPDDQLFVAVSDRGGEVAGEDGGPRTGGKGMWYVGQVAEWTADAPPPIALRDPNTGLIWKGYLQPVLATRVENGRLVATSSTSYFVVNPAAPVRKQNAVAMEGAKPSDAAVTRASHGPGSLASKVRPQVGPGRKAARNAGLSTE